MSLLKTTCRALAAGIVATLLVAAPLVARAQDTPIKWTRTTKAKYWEMLEVLPPALWIGGAFLVGEPTDHHATSGQPRFQAYWERGTSGRPYEKGYFAASRPMTCAELKKEIGRS